MKRHLAALLLATLSLPVLAAPIAVYKDASCGCCAKWIAHMEAHGFTARAVDTGNMNAVRAKYGVPVELRSCHTALVGGYVIEGHVPAADVKRLLAQKPAGVAGLAAPGMPIGSPGMEGGVAEPYEVIAFTKDGKRSVFARH